MMWVLLLLIPITALIDYFAFRKQFKTIYGEEMKWYYFITPCFLEITMFILGYYYAKGGF